MAKELLSLRQELDIPILDIEGEEWEIDLTDKDNPVLKRPMGKIIEPFMKFYDEWLNKINHEFRDYLEKHTKLGVEYRALSIEDSDYVEIIFDALDHYDSKESLEDLEKELKS